MTTQFSLDLRLARRKAGYTQDDLSHLLSVQQSLISDLEHGKDRPSLEQIIDLSLIYGRSIESLFDMLMAERRGALADRLSDLPDLSNATVHTFNRDSSLQRLEERLTEADDHDAA